MKYLPYEKITYKTSLKADEIIERLNNYVEPKQNLFSIQLWGKKRSKTYEGQVEGYTFTINRIISYRNSFLPVIQGNIDKEVNGTTIHVKMHLHTFVIVFLCIWCGPLVLILIAMFVIPFKNSIINPLIFIPLLMLTFMYGLTTLPFKFESSISKKDLQKLFEAEIIEA